MQKIVRLAFFGATGFLSVMGACSDDEVGGGGDTPPDGDAGNDVQSADQSSPDVQTVDQVSPPLDGEVDGGPKCKTASCATAITAGPNHTCALLGDRTVKCWGENVHGELGSGTVAGATVSPIYSKEPLLVPNLTDVVAISAGGEPGSVNHTGITCALLQNGSVRCWGSNTQSQLGGPTDASVSPTGVTVPADASAVAIDVGARHGCLIDTTGALRCWGGNPYGERGNPALSAVFPLDAGVVAVSAGQYATCVVSTNATAICYGYNVNGQSNPFTTPSNMVAPSVVDAGGPIHAVAANNLYACATLDGSAACWGTNVNGQMGKPGSLALNTPASPAFTQGIYPVLVAAGGIHACAIMSDRGVSCWGSNQRGQTGDFTGKVTVNIPIGVGGIAQATGLALGHEHSCALTDDGDIYCWGSHTKAQLGPNVRPPVVAVDAGDGGGDAGVDAAPNPDAGGPDNVSHPDPIKVPL